MHGLEIKYMIEMNSGLSQNQIGRRVAKLRKMKGLSQKDLARSIKMSRPSLAQIELGNRNVDILEMQRISQVLRFSLDEFMAKDFSSSQETIFNVEKKANKAEERISDPILCINKFKNVVLYMLERCAGKPNVGETILYKLMYFTDFNYYELYEEHLTGAKYHKLPYGPIPQDWDKIINEMIHEGQLQKIVTVYQNFTQIRYLPLKKADLSELKASEKEVMDRVIEQMSDWSSAAISNYSHNDMPWLASTDGEEISYELVFYREIPYSVRNYGDEIEEQ